MISGQRENTDSASSKPVLTILFVFVLHNQIIREKKCTQAKQAGSACNNSHHKDNYQQAPGNLDVGLEALGELAAGVEGAEVAAVRQMTGALGPTVEGLPAGTAESLWGKGARVRRWGFMEGGTFFLKRVGGQGSGLDVLNFL